VLAESVGLALLVVLDALALAERLAFVRHDVFGLPFAEYRCAGTARAQGRDLSFLTEAGVSGRLVAHTLRRSGAVSQTPGGNPGCKVSATESTSDALTSL
jgi:hypothetical protein